MDREIKKYNSTTGQWESVYSGGITDGTLLITPDKIGDLSTLQTTVKTNLVSAVNENTAKLSSANATTVTLSRGQNLVTTNPNGASTVPFNVLSIKGRTLINLLGRDGNCEDVSKWTGYQSTLSLDTSNKVYGSNSIKVTGSATNNVQFQHNAPSTIINSNTSYYIILAEVKNGNWAGNFDLSFSDANSSTFVPNASSFTTVYQKLTGDILSGKNISIRAFNGAIGQYFYVDGFRVYQISQSEYNALGTTLTDINKIAEKYPYVDDMKSLQNPYVNVYGQNLLPDFSQWTTSSTSGSPKMVVESSYVADLVADANSQQLVVDIPCIPNQSYTLSVGSMGSAKLGLNTLDSNKTFVNAFGGYSATAKTFTTDNNASFIRVILSNDTAGAGTFTFTNPMLNLGSTALPFVPRNDSPVYFQTTLASSVDGTIYDSVSYQDGKFVKTGRLIDKVLDGSLSWAFTVDQTGNKVVQITLSGAVANKGNSVKYDGKPMSSLNDADVMTSDTIKVHSNGTFFVCIADTDSGWGETYTPTAQEIQAYFNGWMMYDSTTGNFGAYNGTGTKAWIRRNKVTQANGGAYTNGGSSSDTSTTLPATTADNGYTPYRLLYQLAQPTQETIATDGLYPVLQSGMNQVELGEAVQFREQAKVVVGSDGFARINSDYLSSSASRLKYRTEKILALYKGNQLETRWMKTNSDPNDYGKQSLYTKDQFDPTASYSVTYIAQPYAVSSSILSLDGSYESNLRKDVDKNTQNIADLGERLTAVEISKANRQQGQWIAPTLLNGWVNYGGTYDTIGFYKDEFGIVHLRGLIKSGTGSAGTVLFYLPVGYRPSITNLIPTLSNNASTITPVSIEVYADGSVKLTLTTGTTWLALAGITFRAEQ
jgi:hypothetical protein